MEVDAFIFPGKAVLVPPSVPGKTVLTVPFSGSASVPVPPCYLVLKTSSRCLDHWGQDYCMPFLVLGVFNRNCYRD